MGMDYRAILERGRDEYLIDVAMLQKALKLSSERKVEEIKVLAELTGLEVAKTLAKIF